MTNADAVPVVKVSNVDHPLEAWCSMCGNTGWCELAGSTTVFGVTYSRGMAPCRWCQLGAARFRRATEPARDKHDHHRRWTPESRFTSADVVPFGEQEPRPEPVAVPLVRELPGMDDAPVRDFEAAARSCYAAWRRYMGKEPADAKVRRHYPEQAEAVIVEADALDVPAEPVEPSVQDELDDAAIQRDRAGVDDEDVPL